MTSRVGTALGSERKGLAPRFARLAAYGVGDYGLNIYWNMLSLFLVFWYTTVVGLQPEIAGTIYFIGMVWDAFTDPLVANLAERVRTKRGTYRPFLLFGCIPLAVLFVLLFWVPPFQGGALLAALIILGLLFRTSYTLVSIPYAALSARLTFNSQERTELAGVRMFFAFAGLLTVSLFVPSLLRFISGSESYIPVAFVVAAAIGGTVASLALLLCYALTTEQMLPQGTKAPPLNPVAIFNVLRKNHALLILISVIFLQSSGNASLMVSLLFFLDTQAGLAAPETVLTAFAVATMIGVPFWTVVIRWLGKKISWLIAAMMIAGWGAVLLVAGPTPIHGVPLPIAGYGFALGAFAVMLWSFVPDTVEYGEVQTGMRSEGVSFGAVMVAQKLAGATMGLAVGLVLREIGFDPDLAVQDATTGRGLLIFLAIAPGTLFLLSGLPVRFLPLDRRTHANMVQSLAEKNVPNERQA
ncbi:MAG: glycoside-pentoside-hexuronide (GPH):cation symporter [Pseudomonadota bacterium]